MTSSKKIITLLSCLSLAIQGTCAGMLMHHGSNGELESLLAAGVLTLLFLNAPSGGPSFGIGHHGFKNGIFGGHHTSNGLFGGHGSFNLPSLGKLFSHGLPTRGLGLSHGLGISDTFGLSKPGFFHRLHGSHHGLFQRHKKIENSHLFGSGAYNRMLQAAQKKHKAGMLTRVKGGLKNGMFGGHHTSNGLFGGHHASSGLFGGHGLHFGSSNSILHGHKHIRPNFGLFKQGIVPVHLRHSSLFGTPKATSLLKSLLL